MTSHIAVWLGRRRTLVMLDQATSSLSNIVVTVVAARLLTPVAFGAFSVAMVGYQLALEVVRAVAGEPWLSTHSTDVGPRRTRAVADLMYAALAASSACGVLLMVAAIAVDGRSRSSLLALAVVFPILGLQDALRFVAAVDRPGIALASDLSWLVVVVLAVIVGFHDLGPAGLVVVWGGAGGAGLLVALVRMRVSPAGGSVRRWFREHRQMSMAFLGEFASARAVAQLVLIGLGAIAGLGALGAVRAAQVFYGPLNTLFAGIYLALVPEGARKRSEPSQLQRLMLAATAVVTAAAAAWTVVGVALPDRWGMALFGDTWSDAKELMLPMGLAVVAGSLATGGFVGLRSLAASRLSLRARILGLPPQAAATLAGAAVGGAAGYTYGFAVGNAVVALIWWACFVVALRSVPGHAGAAYRPGDLPPTAPVSGIEQVLEDACMSKALYPQEPARR
jgi:O-antigen/teichoic acid export membrane protein